jgi:hypothetical protein
VATFGYGQPLFANPRVPRLTTLAIWGIRAAVVTFGHNEFGKQALDFVQRLRQLADQDQILHMLKDGRAYGRLGCSMERFPSSSASAAACRRSWVH